MTARGPDGTLQAGFWLLQSADLVHWSRPELLVALPLLWQPDCALSHVHAYPALIDPASPDRNFAIASDRVWLTFVRMRLGSGCRPGPERDLVARTVILSGDGSASRPD